MLGQALLTGGETDISARFNSDNTHRFRLDCRWGPGVSLPWVMLNPSLAGSNHHRDNLDPTLRRVKSFSSREGFSAFTVFNLFSVVSPDPKVLAGVDPAALGANREALEQAVEQAAEAGMLVCGWGAHPVGVQRSRLVVETLFEPARVRLVCLGKSRAGHPRHPLYLRNDSPLRDWQGATP